MADGDRAGIPPVRELVRALDWASTPLGAQRHWPQSLKTTVDTMLASGHAMCLAWGPERTLLYNEAYVPLLGGRHPQALGRPLAAAWPEVWSEIRPLVDRCFRGETSTFQDMPLVMTRHGFPEETWWSFSYSPVRDEQDRVAGLLNVTLETTGRVQAERARDQADARLQRQEERLRALVTASTDSVFEASPDWSAVRRLDGRTFLADGTPPRRDWMSVLLFPEDCDAVRAAIQAAIRDKAPFELEHRVRRADGTAGWAMSRAVPLLDPSGEIREWFGTVSDTTARHDALAALQASEAFTRSVLASSTDCIKVLTLDGRLDFLSEGGLEVLQIGDFDEVRGCPWPDLIGEAGSQQARAAIAAARRGEASHFEAPGHTRKGLPKWWSVSVSPIRDGKGEVTRILSVSRDHSEIRASREQQRLLNEELAHRLKNTLAVVQAIASQTLGAGAGEEAMAAFTDRLGALATAHGMLSRGTWSAAQLNDVARNALASFDTGECLSFQGPSITIGPRATLSLALLLHELATNATKYGALSVPGGRVALDWHLDTRNGEEVLALRWQERGGPPAVAPKQRGFGSRIIRMGLDGSGGVELDYGEQGLAVKMSANLADMQHG